MRFPTITSPCVSSEITPFANGPALELAGERVAKAKLKETAKIKIRAIPMQ